ncbi:MAG: AMP-binding protein [Halobacteriota archaeon]|nr:AMP-binding protein [Halobacteriota archaeon]
MASSGSIFDSLKTLGWIWDIISEQRRLAKDYRKLQDERLRALVTHAYENVDFYHKKYDAAGVTPDDIKSVKDIGKLPMVSKDELRKNSPIIAKNIDPKDCDIAATSGSTGSPIEIYIEKKSPWALPYPSGIFPKVALSFLKNLGKIKMMTILVTPDEAAETQVVDSIISIPRSRALHIKVIDALEDPRVHLKAMMEYKPAIITTYPSVLKNLAILCREEGINPPQPNVFPLSAEVLDGHTKKIISEVFKGDLLNIYGATEAEVIALECTKHQGMHIQYGSVVLELLKDGEPVPPGEPGEVVVTNLRNRATPIIRYSGLGDVAVISTKKCSCGNSLPLLERVEGRKADSIVLSDKSIIHPFNLTLAMEHVPSVAKFQVVQEAVDRVKVLVVVENSQDIKTTSPFKQGESSWNMIMENLEELLGGDVSIEIEEVEDIPRSSAGSHTVVRSLIERA